ncbi:hypothetical protein [Mycobacterium xenopi]|nr:hypothetical protein [Mycobacterium xenopi]EID17583.1 hypothetical protein MXEN_01030 [Mycobacterium xenopi RIVM700367]MDA3641772.1 hypothetical protein [Mycobacterium xenopi]MDA3659876.1 hypothetical protein [Mycobacterium xenopi]MDA3663995.1 hypothetical protein [Mycobacterium xenopi]ORX21047.1 hypothetical protein AWC32_02425 [Mycobacterium xenopi]
MPADTGRGLRVLAVGLHQLGAQCETLHAELSAVAVPSFIAASSWQSNAGAVNIAAAGARSDLTAIAHRVATRGANYSKAGTAYAVTDEESSGRFRGLVS